MARSFACHVCGYEVKAPDGAAGRVLLCPRCHTNLTVPREKVGVPSVERVHVPALIPQTGPSPAPLPASPVPLSISQPQVPCRFCGEAILPTAKKCRYCGEFLDPQLRAMQTQPQQPQQPQQVIQVITDARGKGANRYMSQIVVGLISVIIFLLFLFVILHLFWRPLVWPGPRWW